MNTVLRACLLVTAFLFSDPGFAQYISLEWAKTFGDIKYAESYSVITDHSGNVYLTGYFEGTVDFDPGPGTFNLTSNIGANRRDIFIQKLDSAGNFIWAKAIGGLHNDYGQSILVDSSGSVLVAGNFRNAVDFDPGPGVYSLNATNSISMFILKLDSQGDFLWARATGGVSTEDGHAIATDADGNIYATGYFIDTADLDPGPNVLNVASKGLQDICIQKLDSLGNLVWLQTIGGSKTDIGASISLDNWGNLLLTGSIRDTVDFNPGPAMHQLAAKGGDDIFCLKLKNNGDFAWARSFGGVAYDEGFSVATTAFGNTYLTGFYMDTVDFDPGMGVSNLVSSSGSRDIFIEKLDSLGNFVWAKSIGAAATDYGVNLIADATENVYVTGSFAAAMDFDPGPATFVAPFNGLNDAYVVKLDRFGDFVWAKTTGGNNNDFSKDVTMDNQAHLYSTGGFWSTADFNPGTSVLNITSAGLRDYFLQKFGPCLPSLGVDSVIACGSYQWYNGITYTSPPNSAQRIANGPNCDSLITLHLTLKSIKTGTHTITSCDSYVWTDGKTYVANNNSAIDTLQGSNGCDSVVTLDLTILSSSFGQDVVTACDSFTWSNGITYTANNYSATDTLVNSLGCDSIVTLNLTLKNSSSIDSVVACGSYTWTNGITYTAGNSSATDTLKNTFGCDSVVTLNLTIDTVDLGLTNNDPLILANAANARYQWLDCDSNYSIMVGDTLKSFLATSNGTYTVAILQNGCIDTSACITIRKVGLFEESLLNDISLFPNPGTGAVHLDIGELNWVSIKVFGVDGQKVLQNDKVNSSFSLMLDRGVYFIEVSFGKSRKYFKLIRN